MPSYYSKINRPVERNRQSTALLYVDVNLGPNNSERITVYEGDRADQLAKQFCKSHGNILNLLRIIV